MPIKQWILSKINRENTQYLSEKYGISPFLSMLFDIKSIDDCEIQNILQPNYDNLLNIDYVDLKKAADRIHMALENFEKICICGDYDADGVTATSLLYLYLQNCGANVIYKIPDRHKDGYGLNKRIIDEIKSENVNLIVTVDNGITAVEEIAYANSLGIDTVVTDHHKLPATLPAAHAIVDFHRDEDAKNFVDFAGVGVVFKLIIALEGENADLDLLLENYSELALIGTVGDVVPLKGENRLLVKSGLKYINNTDKIGLRALLEKAGATQKEINSTTVAFTVVPRINAAGRLSTTEKVVRLLTSDYEEEAAMIAEKLDAENIKRKEIEKEILVQVEEMLAKNRGRLCEPVLILDGENWHPGVIGIVASKIVDKFGKPAIVLTKNGEVARGSARSIDGFSIYDAINSCRDYLLKFGGHPMAAGFDISVSNIDKFRNDIFKFVETHSVPFSALNIACKLNPLALDINLVNQINLLEPFGKDNEQPIFGLFGMTLLDVVPVGNGNHLRLIFSRDGKKFTVMKFFTTADEFFYQKGDVVDLAVSLSKSTYLGTESLSIFLEDIKFSNIDNDQLLAQKRLYENLKFSYNLASEQVAEILPNREDFSYLYRWLKKKGSSICDVSVLYYRFVKDLSREFGFAKFLVILDVFEELELLTITVNSDVYEIKMNEKSCKVDLDSSEILKKIKSLE